jgi:hypothetical protein
MPKRNRPLVLAGAMLIACLSLPVCATTIIVMQTKDAILLGADARVVSLRAGSDGQTTNTGEACKIVRTAHTAVAVAGILGNPTGFDSAKFLEDNLSEDLPLEMSADALARKIAEPLGRVILELEESAPDQSLVEPGRPALSLVMGRFEDGVMKVAIRDIIYVGHSTDRRSSESSRPTARGVAGDPTWCFPRDRARPSPDSCWLTPNESDYAIPTSL